MGHLISICVCYFQVNVKSLDTVIRYYLDTATKKTEDARAESQQTCLDVDDLDVIQTPERFVTSTLLPLHTSTLLQLI